MGEEEEDLMYSLGKSWKCCAALPRSTGSCDSSAEAVLVPYKLMFSWGCDLLPLS